MALYGTVPPFWDPEIPIDIIPILFRRPATGRRQFRSRSSASSRASTWVFFPWELRGTYRISLWVYNGWVYDRYMIGIWIYRYTYHIDIPIRYGGDCVFFSLYGWLFPSR